MSTLTEYLDSTGLTKQLQPNEKAMFVNMAQMYGLNPFKREIYCTVYGQGQYRQCSIVTGYEVYLKRAERIGKMDGWEVSTTGSAKDGTLAATVTIYRKDWSHPFRHTAYMCEVSQTKKDGTLNHFWAKMPDFMTRKVAIAQAFRLCFPDEFGGMPYTTDELGVENVSTPTERIVQAEVQNVQENAQTVEQAVNDDAQKLKQLLHDYGSQLSNSAQNPTPYDLASDALNGGSNEEVSTMYKRCVVWLGKKGYKVA